jgi:hypothetical protein
MPQNLDPAGAETHSVHALVAWSCRRRRTPGRTELSALVSRTAFLVVARLATGFPSTPRLGWVIAVCAVLADTAHAGVSGRGCGGARCHTVVSCRCDKVSDSAPAASTRDDPSFTGNCARSGSNARLRHHRIRSRRAFQGDLRNAVGVAHDCHLHPTTCGVSVAPREALPLVILLTAETTRGPPGTGAHILRLFDGAGPPGLYLCAAASLAIKAAGTSNIQHRTPNIQSPRGLPPVDVRGWMLEVSSTAAFLTWSRNSAIANYHEYESHPSIA